MIISIIGSGALGKTYGGLLALAGHEVHFLVRSEYAALKKSAAYQMQLKEFDKTLTVNNINIHDDSADLPLSDLVIVSLKTTANDAVAKLMQKCVGENTIVLVIQNGIGNEEWISKFTGKASVVCAISFIGVYREGIDLHIPFLGNLKLAPFGISTLQTCQWIKDAFALSPVPLQITLHDNYKDIRWKKLLWNIPFGALSIIFDRSTHLLANDQPYRAMILNIMHEISLIARAEGVEIDEQFQVNMVDAAIKTGYYLPTIYRDFHEGLMIEKEYLFDHPLAIAKQHAVIVPFLTLIEKELQTLLALREH